MAPPGGGGGGGGPPPPNPGIGGGGGGAPPPNPGIGGGGGGGGGGPGMFVLYCVVDSVLDRVMNEMCTRIVVVPNRSLDYLRSKMTDFVIR